MNEVKLPPKPMLFLPTDFPQFVKKIKLHHILFNLKMQLLVTGHCWAPMEGFKKSLL